MDYEKAYTEAVSKIKSIIADKKKQGLTNCLFEGDLNEIFPELADTDRIRKELLEHCINRRDGKQVCVDASDYRRWADWLEKQGKQNNIVEQLTAFAQHLNKRGVFRDDLCMDFEYEAQSFIESQNNKEL